MIHRMRNISELKVRCYAAHMVEPNEYMTEFLIEKSNLKIGEIKLNGITFNSVTNVWIKQSYVQCFDSEKLHKKSCKYV